MLRAIESLGLKIKKYSPEEIFEFVNFLIDSLPWPDFVENYLAKWFPVYNILLRSYLANAINNFLSALPGDEIEVKNLISSDLSKDIASTPIPPPGSAPDLQETNDIQTTRIAELEATEADLRAHIAHLELLLPLAIPGDAPPPEPPPPIDDGYRNRFNVLVSQAQTAYDEVEQMANNIFYSYEDVNLAPDSDRYTYIGLRQANFRYSENIPEIIDREGN